MGPQALAPVADTRRDLARYLAEWDSAPSNGLTVDRLEVAYGNHAANLNLRTTHLRDIVAAYRRAGFTPAQSLQAIETGIGSAARG